MADIIDIDEIRDRHGNVRRLGTLQPEPGFVSAFPEFVSAVVPWEDAEIRRVLTASDRVPGRVKFGDAWIQNQHSHGSCSGYAAAAALSRARWNQGTATQDGLLLSGAFIYSRVNRGQDRGAVLEDGLAAIQKYGTCPESLVNWDMIYPNQQPASAADEALKHRGIECYALNRSFDKGILELRTAVAAGFVCVVAVHVGSKFDNLKNGVAGLDSGPGNHAVPVSDIETRGGTEYPLVPNSWGLSFGERGHCLITYDHLRMTWANHVMYAVASIQESK